MFAPSLFAQWGQERRISDPTSGFEDGNGLTWNVAASGNLVWIVWSRLDDNYEVFYNFSTDGGGSWSSDQRLTSTDGGVSWFPSVALSGSAVHLVWTDKRDHLMGEVYYNRSLDGGASWKGDTRLTTIGGC